MGAAGRDEGSGRAGQCVFAVGSPNQYSDLHVYVDGLAQNCWVDMEATPSTGTPVIAPHVNPEPS